MSTAHYVERRRRLMAELGAGVVILFTAAHAVRNADTHYPYRADSSFITSPALTSRKPCWCCCRGRAVHPVLPGKDLEREIWDGFRHGPTTRERFAFDQAYLLSELDAHLPKWLGNQPTVHYTWAATAAGINGYWAGWTPRGMARSGVTTPPAIHDVSLAIAEMRLFKDAHEIQRCAAPVKSPPRRMCAPCAPASLACMNTR